MESEKEITIDQIKEKVCQLFNMNPDCIMIKSGKRAYADPKRIICFLARRLTRESLKAIGGQLGGIDHSTVIYHRQICDDFMSIDQSFKRKVNNIERELKEL